MSSSISSISWTSATVDKSISGSIREQAVSGQFAGLLDTMTRLFRRRWHASEKAPKFAGRQPFSLYSSYWRLPAGKDRAWKHVSELRSQLEKAIVARAYTFLQ
ncbi:hypothetical protein VTK56DRAFT_148 [Thermocarpiscus australiensis]